MPGIVIGANTVFASTFGGGIFNPSSQADLDYAFRADLGITIATGVSVWADRSGNGNDILQAVGGNQPAWAATGAPNGHPRVYFNGIDEWLLDAWALVQPVHIFLVAKPSTSGITGGTIVDGPAGAGDDCAVYNHLTGLSIHAGARLTDVATTGEEAQWHWIEALFNGGASSLIADDNAPVAGNAGANDPAGLCLGRRGAGAGYSDCEIAEIFTYTSARSASQLAQIRAYAASYYGLATQ